jgi:hypothetical protein
MLMNYYVVAQSQKFIIFNFVNTCIARLLCSLARMGEGERGNVKHK